jgi:hypothetical protein
MAGPGTTRRFAAAGRALKVLRRCARVDPPSDPVLQRTAAGVGVRQRPSDADLRRYHRPVTRPISILLAHHSQWTYTETTRTNYNYIRTRRSPELPEEATAKRRTS